jgi:hypothetical protein
VRQLLSKMLISQKMQNFKGQTFESVTIREKRQRMQTRWRGRERKTVAINYFFSREVESKFQSPTFLAVRIFEMLNGSVGE